MADQQETANGVEVPRPWGEQARRWLKERGWLAERLRPIAKERTLLLPLRPGAQVAEAPFPRDFVRATFVCLPEPRPQAYQDLVHLLPDLQAQLPRAFDVVGDIVIVRLPPALDAVASEVGKALLSFVPGSRLIAQSGGVHGPHRTRDLRAIAGQGSWRTIHQENGLRFQVDLSRAYFSPRLAREHQQVAALSLDGESILDLFCGVGPFSLTILKRRPTTTAHAVDSNPEAISLLEENARKLGVAQRIRSFCQDARSHLAEPRDYSRVIANLPHEGYKYASLVAKVVRPGGHLHIYEVAPRTGVSRVQEALEGLSGPQGDWTVLDRHVVHGYSASEDLIGLHFLRTR